MCTQKMWEPRLSELSASHNIPQLKRNGGKSSAQDAQLGYFILKHTYLLFYHSVFLLALTHLIL